MTDMDLTTEKNLIQTSTDLYEEIEEFLQTYNPETSTSPEPEFCTPLPMQTNDIQQELTQSEEDDLDMLSDITEVISTDQNVTSIALIYSAATSQMTEVTDVPMTVSCRSETLSDIQAASSGGEQAVEWSPLNSSGHQHLYGGEARDAPSHQQPHQGSQMTSLSGGCTQPFCGGQAIPGGQMVTASGGHTLSGDQMMAQQGDLMKTLLVDCAFSGDGTESSPLPQSGYLNAVSAHQTQEETLKKQNFKTQAHKLHYKPDRFRPYRCLFEGCAKSYLTPSHLRIHEMKHTGEKPYACDVMGCPWKFTRLFELRRHKETHSGGRRYQCTQCSKNYARADYLKAHERSHKFH